MTAIAEMTDQATQPVTEPASQLELLPAPDTKQLAKKLKQNMAACQLRKSKWQLNRKLEHAQVAQAAQNFSADARFIGASKKLIDPRNKKYRECGSILNDARAYWKSVTIPFPEDGVRLIRRDHIAKFTETMNQFRVELTHAAAELQQAYDEIREEAKAKLGDLYNESEYPADVTSLFGITWEFPPLDPPNYLLEIDPTGKLYEQQKELMEARFQESVALTEAAFTKAFHDMVTHLADRLQWGEADATTGEKKPLVFRDTAVENLQAFFEQFKALNVGSNPNLDALVEQAKELVGTTTPEDIRKDVTMRQNLQVAMAQLGTKLDQLMVAKPIRQMSLLDEE
jgi:hypothetical protein